MNLTGTSSSQLQAALSRLRELSIPELLAQRVAEQPDAVAVRFKRGGIFRELTWKVYREEIRRVAAGLLACGLKPGARIAIMGDVSIEYLAGGSRSHLHRRDSVRHLSDQFARRSCLCASPCGRTIFIAEDQEHLDRLLDAEASENAPLVDKIIICDERALFLYDDPRIEIVQRALAEGTRRHRDRLPRSLELGMQSFRPRQPAPSFSRQARPAIRKQPTARKARTSLDLGSASSK